MKTYQYLWRLMCYRPLLYLGNAIAWSIIHFSELLPGIIASWFFDALSGEAAAGLNVWTIIITYFAVALGRMGTVFCGAQIDIRHRFLMGSLLRRNMLERILKRPGARALVETPGETLNRFRDDTQQVVDQISMTVDSLGFVITTTFAVVMLAHISWKITLLVFAPMVIILAITQAASTRLEKNREASRDAAAKVAGALGEMFGSIQAVQVATAEEQVADHLQRLNAERKRLVLKDRLIVHLLNSIYGSTISLGTGLVLILAAGNMLEGHFSVGDFALFAYFLEYVTDITMFIGEYWALYKQTGVSLKRMTEILPGEPQAVLVAHNELPLKGKLPDDRDGAGAFEPLICLETENLTYHHPESGKGIEGINLRLKKGAFTVITGRIGSGKTTLLRTLLGLLPKEDGEIRWNGTRVEHPADFFTPPYTAYTPQVPVLFSETIRENVLMGFPAGDAEIEQAVVGAVLETDLAGMEQGLATVVGTKGVKLSGGQMQRVAAARMLVRNAELMVFDDLSSALDVNTEGAMWSRLFARREATYLVVSHRKAALRHADQIIILKNGKVEDQGTLEELLVRSAEMRNLWAGDAGNAENEGDEREAQ
ncbi:MAG TPA: ABC transporter ATP-binding protein [Firmicutes bacterium]|jgi:ATP-binding cassette subfamily B protein|nr:ABC transporter ATP-binding protein [Bacillota bacterium]